MKANKRSLIILIVFGLLLLSGTLFAQDGAGDTGDIGDTGDSESGEVDGQPSEDAAADVGPFIVEAEPGQISVAGIKGDSGVRTLLLSADGDVNSLSIAATDLGSETDTGVIPASAIRFAEPLTSLSANQLTPLTVTVDLVGAASGRYTGNIIIVHPDGRVQIPVSAAIKDQPFWPATAIFFSVVIGLIFSAYERFYKPADQVRSDLGRLRQAIGSNQPTGSLGAALSNKMDLVNQHVKARDLTAARNALNEAQTLWQQWLINASAWRQLENFGGAVLPYLEQVEAAGHLSQPIANYLRTQAQETLQNTSAEPQAAQTILEQLNQQITEHDRFWDHLDRVTAGITNLPAENQEPFEPRLQSIQDAYDALMPPDLSPFTQIQADLEALAADVRAARPTRRGPGGAIDTGAGDLDLDAAAETARRPPTFSASLPRSRMLPASVGRAASLRLSAYSVLLAIGVALAIAITGYIQLYVNDPTFGDGGLSDYMTLLTFGFGAETARRFIEGLGRGETSETANPAPEV